LNDFLPRSAAIRAGMIYGSKGVEVGGTIGAYLAILDAQVAAAAND
jgi:hypothetical protein